MLNQCQVIPYLFTEYSLHCYMIECGDTIVHLNHGVDAKR